MVPLRWKIGRRDRHNESISRVHSFFYFSCIHVTNDGDCSVIYIYIYIYILIIPTFNYEFNHWKRYVSWMKRNTHTHIAFFRLFFPRPFVFALLSLLIVYVITVVQNREEAKKIINIDKYFLFPFSLSPGPNVRVYIYISIFPFLAFFLCYFFSFFLLLMPRL
jgi:hypothetical protein